MKKSNSLHVVSLQLVRQLDAFASPYSMCLARCSRAPTGLHLGLLAGGTQAYCVDTLRQTGDANMAKGALKGGSGGKSGSGGKGGSGGWGGWSSWKSNQAQSSWGAQNDGWGNARQSQSGWASESRGFPAPASSASAAAAAVEVDEEEEQQQKQEHDEAAEGGGWPSWWGGRDVDPDDEWAQ